VSIIEIPNYGNLAAVTLVEEKKVQSHKDTKILKEIKDIVYQKGFYEGVMTVGAGAGMKVQDAKPIVRKVMLDSGEAAAYYEPEEQVISRTGDECVVALCDQWFLRYGEEEWRNFIMDHVKSGNFQTYGESTMNNFKDTINWMNEWACSRTQGLGTKIPWDPKFVIESLSDSTIYMAYYTVAHLLQGGVLDGSVVGPAGIKADDLTPEVWDYIYRKGAYPAGCPIPEEKLKELRYEFEYWYPMDLRCSGKDLIRNHLTFALYNHAAVWQKQEMMPRGFYCNGYIMVDG